MPCLKLQLCGWIWLWFHSQALVSCFGLEGPMVSLHMIRLPEGSLSGHQSSNGLMRIPFPPRPGDSPGIHWQKHCLSSGEGRTCFPRSVINRACPYPSIAPWPPSANQPGSLARSWVLSFLPLFSQGSSSPSLLHLVKRSIQACFCFYLNLAPMPMSNSSQREGLLLSGTRKISPPSN